ncbi:pentalenene synthase [Streptomyces sp. DT2A-34]|uniref:terpene synthase family protein n=1 Tax=Streptomyces sp. DT2A-34 TaxID=3051182 RepID=UPI00265C00C4|nr:pentalenene synthase [Streptomyces sp. DT2A-34]MDO0916241.1 pentalenene synthase [Streptomyces sp. DT2A-34]
MPQNITINLPIPPRLNSGLAAARDRNLEWMRRQKLVLGHSAARRYVFSAVADLAAYSYPDAAGEDLDLAFDTMGWFFLFDDLFDVPEGRTADEAVDVCQQLIALITHPSPRGADHAAPLVSAFADIWRRARTGMSEEWQLRAAHNWVDYLSGNLTEEIDRRTWAPQDFATRMRIGHRTLGLIPSLDLAERVGHFEIPQIIWHSSHLESMRRAAVDAVKLINEVMSLENDDARGDPNLVHCLMRQRDCSRQEAIRVAVTLVQAAVSQLFEQVRRTPLFCSRLGLTSTEADKVQRYATAMFTWIRGSYDWSRNNGRYSPHTASALSPDVTGQLHPANLAPVSP